MAVFVPQQSTRAAVPYGNVEQLAPGLRRITANNPGAMTGTGTGTYIVGDGQVAVIDPGPYDTAHIAALVQALSGETIGHILITHTHVDHSPGTALLQQYTDAPTVGFGPHADHDDGSGDHSFRPDITVQHGQWITGAQYELECLHTPGHCANHLCFAQPSHQRIFCGDLVMGWSTTLVSPPDGSISDYLSSLALLAARSETCYWPTHGQEVQSVQAFVQMLREHRLERVAEVHRCVAAGMGHVSQMVPHIYTELNPALYPIAAHSVLASLQYLVDTGQVVVDQGDSGQMDLAGHYQLANTD